MRSLIFLGAVFPTLFLAVALACAGVGLMVRAVRRRHPLEPNVTKRSSPSVIKCLLWALLYLAMWFWAIAGSLIIACTAVSFFADISPVVGMDFFGESVRSTGQKIRFLGFNAVIAFLGIGFLLLYRWGYLKDPL